MSIQIFMTGRMIHSVGEPLTMFSLMSWTISIYSKHHDLKCHISLKPKQKKQNYNNGVNQDNSFKNFEHFSVEDRKEGQAKLKVMREWFRKQKFSAYSKIQDCKPLSPL